MSEMRQNRITGQWIIYAATRRTRPHDAHRAIDEKEGQPAHVPTCPFCPGNEHMTPPTLLQLPEGNVPWHVRAFANKFPILSPNDGRGETLAHSNVYISAAGYGHHEVVVETPYHNEDLAHMPRERAEAVIEACRRRYLDVRADERVQSVFLFRNHGIGAGASLAHPHSQVIGTDVIPLRVRERESATRRYFEEQGRCAYCDILEFEARAGQRVVYQNGSFLAFVPYAAEAPLEVWIAPYEHRSDFDAAPDAEMADLADAWQVILRRLYHQAHDPDYNYIFYTASKASDAAPHIHWYVQIRPRAGIEAGFEIGSGMLVNMSNPEEDALLLRTQ